MFCILHIRDSAHVLAVNAYIVLLPTRNPFQQNKVLFVKESLFGQLTFFHFPYFKTADRFLSNNLSLVVCISS